MTPDATDPRTAAIERHREAVRGFVAQVVRSGTYPEVLAEGDAGVSKALVEVRVADAYELAGKLIGPYRASHSIALRDFIAAIRNGEAYDTGENPMTTGDAKLDELRRCGEHIPGIYRGGCALLAGHKELHSYLVDGATFWDAIAHARALGPEREREDGELFEAVLAAAVGYIPTDHWSDDPLVLALLEYGDSRENKTPDVPDDAELAALREDMKAFVLNHASLWADAYKQGGSGYNERERWIKMADAIEYAHEQIGAAREARGRAEGEKSAGTPWVIDFLEAKRDEIEAICVRYVAGSTAGSIRAEIRDTFFDALTAHARALGPERTDDDEIKALRLAASGAVIALCDAERNPEATADDLKRLTAEVAAAISKHGEACRLQGRKMGVVVPDDAGLVRLQDAVHEAILELAKDFDDDKTWWDQERINVPLTAYGAAQEARGRALGRVEGLREARDLFDSQLSAYFTINERLAEAEAAL